MFMKIIKRLCKGTIHEACRNGYFDSVKDLVASAGAGVNDKD